MDNEPPEKNSIPELPEMERPELQQYVVTSGINTQYIVMFNVLLGCTHFEQIIKQKYLCNITTDLHLKRFLDHCRRPSKVSVKPGKREPMGRRASLVASGMDTGEGGVYKSQHTPSEYSEQSHLTILSHINKEEQYATWQTYD